MKAIAIFLIGSLVFLLSGCNQNIPNSRSNPYPIGLENPTYGDVFLVVPASVVINSINGEKHDLFSLTRKKQAYIVLPEGRHQIQFEFRGIVGSIFNEESKERITIEAEFEGYTSYTLGVWAASIDKPIHFGGDANFGVFKSGSVPISFEVIERKEKY